MPETDAKGRKCRVPNPPGRLTCYHCGEWLTPPNTALAAILPLLATASATMVTQSEAQPGSDPRLVGNEGTPGSPW